MKKKLCNLQDPVICKHVNLLCSIECIFLINLIKLHKLSVYYSFTAVIDSNDISNITPIRCQVTDSDKMQVPEYLLMYSFYQLASSDLP